MAIRDEPETLCLSIYLRNTYYLSAMDTVFVREYETLMVGFDERDMRNRIQIY